MYLIYIYVSFFFFKQKTAYEWRISDWSSDVCSSDLDADDRKLDPHRAKQHQQRGQADRSVEYELARARQPAPIVAEEATRPAPEEALRQIGRASCRERVCQYV